MASIDKWVYKGKQFIKSHSNIHVKGDKSDVMIFSTPRSGSTWLMELIWTQKGFKYVNEPLNLRVAKVREKLGLNSWDEMYYPESKQKMIDYFQSFSNGKYHFADPNPVKKYYRPITNRIVFKVLHGGENWINDIAAACQAKVIFLIRHPIAVSVSRKQLPRLDLLCSDEVLSYFPEHMVQKAQDVYRNGDFLDKAVLSWCIQNKIALGNRTDDWMVITYEQLTTDPLPIISRLIDELQLQQKDRLFERLSVPSGVKNLSDEYTQKLLDEKSDKSQELVEKWRKKISPETEKELFEIIDTFEIDIYECGNCYPKAAYSTQSLETLKTER